MHPDLAEKFLERVRLRVAQGDTPTEPALSRENLEDLVLTMDAELTALRQRVVEKAGQIAEALELRMGFLKSAETDSVNADDDLLEEVHDTVIVGTEMARIARALINEIKETTDGL